MSRLRQVAPAAVRLVVAALLLTLLIRSGGIDWHALGRVSRTWWLPPLLVAFALFGAVTEAARLSIILRSQALRIPLGYAIRLVLIAMFVGIGVPGGTGGDVMKLYYLASDHRTRAIEVATALLADRAIAMMNLLMLICLFGLLNLGLLRDQALIRTLVTAAAGALVAVLLAAIAVSSDRWQESGLAAVAGRYRIGRWLVRAAGALRLLRGHRAAVAGTFGMALISQLAMGLVFVLIASVALPGAPSATVPLLGWLGMFANALPVTPAGLGVGEVAFDRLFGLIAVSGGAVLVLAWRITLIPLYVTGCILYLTGRGRPPAPGGVTPPAGGHAPVDRVEQGPTLPS